MDSETRTFGLIALVETFEPFDERSASSRNTLLKFLANSSAPFDREAGPEHVTASGFVLSPASVLLHRHRLANVWVGPGGHVDEGESPEDAVVREVLEETGIVVEHPAAGPRLADIDVHPTSNGHVHYDLRFLLLRDSEPHPNPPPEESQEVEWLDDTKALARAVDVYRDALKAVFALRSEYFA